MRDKVTGALVERTVGLRPEPSSARVARLLLRSALAEAGRSRWCEDSELALSEVVTNAVLHGHTDFRVTVRVHPDSVHVEVQDNDPTPPVARHYDEEATTGRGMALVAALTARCGVSRIRGDGKIVWFRVEDPDPAQDPSVGDLLAAWEVTGDWDAPSRDDPAEREVVLEGIPPALWLAARQHHDALLRELALYGVRQGDTKIDLARADRARNIVSIALVRALEETPTKAQAGDALPLVGLGPLGELPARMDLAVWMPERLAGDYGMLQEALDFAEHLAADGQLLCHPGLPEIVAVRDWVCDQVVAQLAGAPPRPWPGSADERLESPPRASLQSEPLTWDVRVVADSTRGAVAADAANRIIAVSRPLADALGWTVEELVGRRLVTIIPPRLREAHVAGFSAHLATGEVHILGRRLRLPALRADGTEILCSYLVQAASTLPGRPIFVAWIEPVDERADL